MMNKFDFEIRFISGKENRVEYAISIWIHVHHLVAMSSYGMELQDTIL